MADEVDGTNGRRNPGGRPRKRSRSGFEDPERWIHIRWPWKRNLEHVVPLCDLIGQRNQPVAITARARQRIFRLLVVDQPTDRVTTGVAARIRDVCQQCPFRVMCGDPRTVQESRRELSLYLTRVANSERMRKR